MTLAPLAASAQEAGKVVRIGVRRVPSGRDQRGEAGGDGARIGLSRKFIELHGGRIWVKSQVGKGSTFTFTIPVRRAE
jgi:signal transduction histidine kinase